MPKFSIVIPSCGRGEALYDCKESLYQQSEQDFEIIIVTEEGPLAKIRNLGAKRASGNYLVFIDDDVVCSVDWLKAMSCAFDRGVAGVSGPARIPKECRGNRDIFRFEFFAGLLSEIIPGFISPWGMHSLASSKENCSYEGEVDYLEACNMGFNAAVFWQLGGFDERYGGVGEWSEPDLCFRIREAGHKLWFARDAKLDHRPSQAGPYKKRLLTQSRMDNYELFSKRWLKPCLRHSLYKLAIRCYFKLKEKLNGR